MELIKPIKKFLCLILISVFFVVSCAPQQTISDSTPEAGIQPPRTLEMVETPIKVTAEPERQETQISEPTVTINPSQESSENTHEQNPDSTLWINYKSQSGDTLEVVAAHFDVKPEDIRSSTLLPKGKFLQTGTELLIPNSYLETGPSTPLLPDSEVIFAISAADFDVNSFTFHAGGFVYSYGELRGQGWYSGPSIIAQSAIDYSINPRLLLALLEYNSHWVYGKPTTKKDADYPMGIIERDRELLFSQMGMAAQYLNVGYYGWRSGTLTELVFPDNTHLRLAPSLNAGSVALQYLMSKIYNPEEWHQALYSHDSVIALYERMFNDPWERAKSIEPLIPGDLTQPTFVLPLVTGRSWNYTGGPHAAWGTSGARAALDFAPAGIKGCSISKDWVTAIAPGIITRVGEGPIIQDLDGDGFEQTGWAILYMHIASKDRIQSGTIVDTNDPIGHPSCYGGHSTGTHLHIARKYNGEWMLADGPVPFVLSGWQARNYLENYKGELFKGDDVIISSQVSVGSSLIIRQP